MNAVRRLIVRAAESAFLWGAALTAAFYAVVMQESFNGSPIRYYTSEHAVEYFIVGFFIWGMLEVAFRAVNYPREWRAFKQLKLPAGNHTDALLTHLARQPQWLRGSRYWRRLDRAVRGLGGTADAQQARALLVQLADEDQEQAHANYGLVRFIVWLAPVLGFLGTVLHFGSALSGLSPDTIADQLSHIVGEMGTAFNTTTSALAASTTMMFALFLGERAEKKLVKTINERVEHDLLGRFQDAAPWGAALEGLPPGTEEHFAEAGRALQRFIEHSASLMARHLAAWEQASAAAGERFAEQERTLNAAVAQIVQRAERVDATTGALTGLLREHDRFNGIQDALSQNLRRLNETGQFEQVIHQLTAAIHLLNGRQRGISGPESRAA